MHVIIAKQQEQPLGRPQAANCYRAGRKFSYKIRLLEAVLVAPIFPQAQPPARVLRGAATSNNLRVDIQRQPEKHAHLFLAPE